MRCKLLFVKGFLKPQRDRSTLAGGCLGWEAQSPLARVFLRECQTYDSAALNATMVYLVTNIVDANIKERRSRIPRKSHKKNSD